MDEASIQLLNEFYQATATIHVEHTEMASPSASSDSSDATPNGPSTPQTSPAQGPNPGTIGFPRGPIDAIHSSLLSGRFSDLMVLHGSQKWSAHKLVICSQSSILESMIEQHIENINNKPLIDLSPYDTDATQKLMEYLYSGTYTSQYDTAFHAPSFSLHLHTNVFALASRFQILGLAKLAVANFRATLAERVKELDVYFEVVARVYNEGSGVAGGNVGGAGGEERAGPDNLRGVVVEVAVVEMEGLLRNEAVRGRLFEVMNACPEFHADVLRGLLRTRPVEMEVQILCPDCGAQPPHDPYEINIECRGCGKQRTLEFY